VARDRTKFISGLSISRLHEVYLPGRKGKYRLRLGFPVFFTGVDFENKTKRRRSYKILNDYGEGWEDVVDDGKAIMIPDVQ